MCELLMVDVKEAARRLSLGRSLTYTLIQQGALPSVKVGGARRVLVRDLEAFAEAVRAGSVDIGNEEV